MPVSSLPSKYGIGSLGRAAHDFIDFLDAAGQKCWQVLPLNPTSYGDSPYQSPASAAGSPYYIGLDILAGKGLLTRAELAGYRDSSPKVDYGRLFSTRCCALRLAHSRFVSDRAYSAYVRENASWLEAYALFMALKNRYNHIQWTLWNDEHRDYKRAILHHEEFEEEMSFWRWCQYEFDSQWRDVVAHAHKKGIVIIGDMPIYAAHDSVDVWASPEQFLLDSGFNPTVVAGCPPDGFSEDGQLWGNPIYDWKKMADDGFSWWLERVGNVFRRYDILRIDHFRGFAGYYNVHYGESTARNGKWDSAPGVELFRTIRKAYPDIRIIAEDLGFIADDVRELLMDTGFPGMKMLHFAFYDENSEYLPRVYDTENCVVYVSTHDSDCTVSWVKNLSREAKLRFDRECPRNTAQSRTYDLIELALRSIANLVMVSMQDYLLLSNKQGRINEPSTAEGNWTWRMSPRYNTSKLRESILDITARTGRSKASAHGEK